MKSKTHQKRTKKRIMNLQQKPRGGYNPNQSEKLLIYWNRLQPTGHSPD